jgi:hypothetical protein
MRKLLVIIVILWTFHSCVVDSVYTCVIKNTTNDKVQINIFFDKHTLDSLYKGDAFFTYLKNNVGRDSGASLNQFDTIKLIGLYTLSPKSEFTLEHGMSGPNYSFYRSIVAMHNNNTMILHNKDEIREAFKYDEGKYVFTIK